MTTLFELPQSEPPKKAYGFRLFSHSSWPAIAQRVDADVLEALQRIRPFDSTLAWSEEWKDAYSPRGVPLLREQWLIVKGKHDDLLALGARQGPQFKTLRVLLHDSLSRYERWLLNNDNEKRKEVDTEQTRVRDRLLGRVRPRTENKRLILTRPGDRDPCRMEETLLCNGKCEDIKRTKGVSSLDLHDEEHDVWFSLTQPHAQHKRGAVGTEKLEGLKRRAQARGLGRE